MSRSTLDYNFRAAVKACGEHDAMPYTQESNPAGPCRYATVGCQWYRMCDLPQKNPPAAPTLPLTGRIAV